ncbi:MAG: hypothetical protein ABWW69_03810 [Pyrodictiaceae archaeon]
MAESLSLLEAAVIAAVAQGIDSIKGLEQLVNVSREELERIILRLANRGLLRIEEKGFIFKRRVLRLTEEGFNKLEEARRLLMRAAEEVKGLAERREESISDEVSRSYELLTPIIPLLVWMDLLDAAILAQMTAPLPASNVGDSIEDQESIDEDNLDNTVDVDSDVDTL